MLVNMFANLNGLKILHFLKNILIVSTRGLKEKK